MIRSTTSLILALSLAAGAAWAQEATEGETSGGAAAQATEDAATAGAEAMMEGHDMAGMGHGMMMSDDPAMQDLMAPMHDMMIGMPMQSTGDLDADFLLMMIPHHQSAIDMARVVLEQGDDEETRAMAQAIVDAQEAEIAEMQAMLERLGQGGAAAPAEGEAAPAEGEAATE
ncbi:DUF305 domain-containing protein [Rubellimicrobium roseum]|uniref:DUF305 domain-containing protein n=1 Tax=Rubellimicrobium roseum TaxID=687525 RepID=A0A5C4NGS9_9RHOB|nr:DUF305 domain-containing protein [Rubellimicrobium roseum]TNC73075.1 DUF305 domain-containing protein [Rubellimicrobium roseum]